MYHDALSFLRRRTLELSGKPQRPSEAKGARICPLERIVRRQTLHHSALSVMGFSVVGFILLPAASKKSPVPEGNKSEADSTTCGTGLPLRNTCSLSES